jgi:hypothetical protein
MIVLVLWWTWPTDPATLTLMSPMRDRARLAAPGCPARLSDANAVAAVLVPREFDAHCQCAPAAPNAGFECHLGAYRDRNPSR